MASFSPRSLVVNLFVVVAVVSLSMWSVLQSARSYAFDVAYYQQQYRENGVDTMFFAGELLNATYQLHDYLKGNTANLSFFSERDRLHLIDVQQLFHYGFVMYYIIIILLLCSLSSIIWFVGDTVMFLKKLCTIFFASATVNFMFVVVAYFAKNSFDWLFLQFHLVSFENQYWLLNPFVDRLIQLFPEMFWYTTAVKIVLMMLFFSVLFVYAGVFTGIFIRKRS